MKFKELVENNPEWVETIEWEIYEHTRVWTIKCIGRMTPMDELQELVLDSYELKDIIKISVEWDNQKK